MAGTNDKKLNKEVEDLVRSYRQVLEEAGVAVEKLIVFGSQAKGTAKEWSDIDVAVVSSDFGNDYHDEGVRLMRLRRSGSLAIEPHPLTPEDLDDEWDSFAHEVREYGIPVE